MFTPAIILSDQTGGIDSRKRPTKIDINEWTSIVSMDFEADSLRRAKGFTLLGTDEDTELTGKSLYKHKVLSGTEVFIKQIGTFLYFYDSIDDYWYKMTDATFTTGKRWHFFSFNSYLYGASDTDGWIYWKGSAWTTVDGVVSIGASTIDLVSATNFPSSGYLMVRGVKITYTGKSTNQLTGVTGVTAEIPDGSRATTLVDTTTYTALSDAVDVAFFNNRSFVIDADSPNIVRHSKLADNTNPETDLVNYTVAGTGAGDAGYGIAPDKCIGFKVFTTESGAEILGVFCENGHFYSFAVTDGSSTTVNVFNNIKIFGSYPTKTELIDISENDIIIVDNFDRVRSLGYPDVSSPIKVTTIGDKIEPSLKLINFNDGKTKYYDRKIHILCKSQDAVNNDLVLYHNGFYNAWGSYGHWEMVDLEIYNNELYGLSASGGEVYKVHYGFNANDEDYYSEAITGKLHADDPLRFKTMNGFRVRGYITSNCEYKISFYFDDNNNPIEFTIDGDDTDIISSLPSVASGSVVFGQTIEKSDSLPGDIVRKEYWAQCIFNAPIKFLTAQMKISMDGQEIDAEFTNLKIYANLEPERLWSNNRTLKRN